MKFRHVAVLIVAVFVLSCNGQSQSINPAVQAMSAIRPGAIRSHIRYLSDDLLEGRGTGTRGYLLAAKYVAAQFEGMGIQPAGKDGGYFQPVSLRNTQVVRDQSTLAI